MNHNVLIGPTALRIQNAENAKSPARKRERSRRGSSSGLIFHGRGHCQSLRCGCPLSQGLLCYLNSRGLNRQRQQQEEGSLGNGPSDDLIKESRKAVSRVESDISLCKAAKDAMEAEAKRLPEEEKSLHGSVIQLEEFYQTYDSIIKKSENSAISRPSTVSPRT